MTFCFVLYLSYSFYTQIAFLLLYTRSHLRTHTFIYTEHTLSLTFTLTFTFILTLTLTLRYNRLLQAAVYFHFFCSAHNSYYISIYKVEKNNRNTKHTDTEHRKKSQIEPSVSLLHQLFVCQTSSSSSSSSTIIRNSFS